MGLTIDLPAEVEQELIRRAAAEGKDVATYVVEVVTEKLIPAVEQTPTATSTTFGQRLREIIARHGVDCGTFDDSRESIYAGRE